MKRGTASPYAILALSLVIVILGLLTKMAFIRFYRAAYPMGYREIVVEQSERNGLAPELVFAVIRSESGFDPLAASYLDTRGLMQISKDTFEWARYRLAETEPLSFDALYDPETNIRYGTVILRLLLDEFESERVALCAYHAGWGSVKRWLGDQRYSPDGSTIETIPFKDTNAYVHKVLETRDAYLTLYKN